jgi:hypothetical protein
LTAGCQVKVRAAGHITATVSAGATYTFTIRIGGVALVGTTGTFTTAANQGFYLEAGAYFTAVGAGGKYNSYANYRAGADGVGTNKFLLGGASQVSLDTTAVHVVDVFLVYAAGGGPTDTIQLDYLEVSIVG